MFCGGSENTCGIFLPLLPTASGRSRCRPSQWNGNMFQRMVIQLTFAQRGANPQELSESSFSWNRPEWLLKDRSTWLKMRMKNRPSNSSEDRPNKKSSNEDGVVILNTCYCQHPALKQKESNERKVVKGRLDLELMHSRDSQIAVKFKGDE